MLTEEETELAQKKLESILKSEGKDPKSFKEKLTKLVQLGFSTVDQSAIKQWVSDDLAEKIAELEAHKASQEELLSALNQKINNLKGV